MRPRTTVLCTAALLGLGAAGCSGGVTIQTNGADAPVAASAQPPATAPTSSAPAPSAAATTAEPLPALQTTQALAVVSPTPAPAQPTQAPQPPPQQAVHQQSGCGAFTPAEASAVGSTLIQYFDGITSGNYAGAWDLLTSSDKSRIGGYDAFADGDSSSTDTDIVYHGESLRSDCQVAADVTFTSYQAPGLSPDGEDSCDSWDLVYYLAAQPGGYWLIDNAQPAHGNGWSSCG